MSAEAAATLLGALIGVGGTVIGSVVTWALTSISSNRRAVRDARIALAREIVRNRGDQALVAPALSEIPVVFGDDDDLMRLYRQFIDGTRTNDTLLDIVARVSKVTKINDKVTPSDLKNFIQFKP